MEMGWLLIPKRPRKNKPFFSPPSLSWGKVCGEKNQLQRPLLPQDNFVGTKSNTTKTFVANYNSDKGQKVKKRGGGIFLSSSLLSHFYN